MADLTVATDQEGADVVVRVGGDLDDDSHGRLEQAVDAALDGAPAGFVLDLAAVTYCDSCGLRVLLGAHRRAGEVGATSCCAARRASPPAPCD